MITFDHDNSKLLCDREEWECYSNTPDSVIEEINELVYAVVTTNTDPVVAQKIIYDTINANNEYRGYGFRDSECDQCTTNIINWYYGSKIDRWANLDLKSDQKWVFNVTKHQKEMKKYQELEQKIQELQKEVDRLKKEEQENTLPDGFEVEKVLEFLKDASKIHLIDKCFSWKHPFQCDVNWFNIYVGNKPLTDKDIIQLQKWVILYYQQQQQSK